MKTIKIIMLLMLVSMMAFSQSNYTDFESSNTLQEQETTMSYAISENIPFNPNSTEYQLSKEALTTFVKLKNQLTTISVTEDLYNEVESEIEQSILSLFALGISNPFDFISQIESNNVTIDYDSQNGALISTNRSGPGCLPEPNKNCIPLILSDDGSSSELLLPFTFELYGTPYNSVYINANGNLTFDAALSSFSSSGFPIATPMIAPFWGDFDFSICGTMCYEITPAYLIVYYQFACPYQTDYGIYNTMSVAIGTLADPVTGVGNNVVFDYRNMDWTTGDASQGVDGFGGIPATVGINAGDGIDFVQIGRFDHPGVDYDGPGDNNDGVDYLDNQCIAFNSAGVGNLPPSVVGLPIGNTIDITCEETVNFTVQFSGPEVGQNITVSANDNGVCGITAVTTDGAVGQVVLTVEGSACNVGTNTIVLTATDDGDPNETTTVTITINVDPSDCLGCTNQDACNFDADATIDDDSCILAEGCDECNDNGGVTDNPEIGDDCDDGDETTFNDVLIACDVCEGVIEIIPGCTDSEACNYNITATVDDDSCILATGCDECNGNGGVIDNPEIGDDCDDGDENTINDVLTACDVCEGVDTSCPAPSNNTAEGAALNTPDRLWGVPGWDSYDVGCATLSMKACEESDATSDTWYKFVAQSENQGILARPNPTDANAANVDLVVQVFDAGLNPLIGDSGGECLVDRSCFNNYGNGQIERCVPGDLTIGETYIYRVYDANGPAVATSLFIDTKVKTYADHPIVEGCIPTVSEPTHKWTIEEPHNLYNIPPVPVFYVRMVAKDLGGAVVSIAGPKTTQVDGGLIFELSEFLPALANGNYTFHAENEVKMMANGCISAFWSQSGPACDVEVVPPTSPTANGPELNSLDESSLDLSFTVSPNPNNGNQVYIQFDQLLDTDHTILLDMYDMYGKKVYGENFVNGGNEINKIVTFNQKLSVGLYFINLSVNGIIMTEKLIVE